MTRKRSNRRRHNKYHPPVTITPDAPITTIPAPNPDDKAIKHDGHIIKYEFFSGPLPRAEMLYEYEKFLPGSADRIFKMAEQQSEHRQFLEKRIIASDIIRSYFGIVCALAVALFGMYVARDIVLSGKQITGTLFGVGTLAALVGAFLTATHDRKETISRTRKQEGDLEPKQNQPNR